MAGSALWTRFRFVAAAMFGGPGSIWHGPCNVHRRKTHCTLLECIIYATFVCDFVVLERLHVCIDSWLSTTLNLVIDFLQTMSSLTENYESAS